MSEDRVEYTVINKNTQKRIAAMTPFELWWYSIGSGVCPDKRDDMESHAHNIARLAWDTAIEFNNETNKGNNTK